MHALGDSELLSLLLKDFLGHLHELLRVEELALGGAHLDPVGLFIIFLALDLDDLR